MPDQARVIVTNTTPLIALTAATVNLDVLRALYTQVVVPHEVATEIRAGGKDAFGLDVFDQASWLEINPAPVVLHLTCKTRWIEVKHPLSKSHSSMA
jgi:predicted nucleic acid-binding protein